MRERIAGGFREFDNLIKETDRRSGRDRRRFTIGAELADLVLDYTADPTQTAKLLAIHAKAREFKAKQEGK